MNETLTITFKGRKYSVTITNTMEVLWTCEATSMAPPLSLSQMLNRCVLDQYAQKALATWGREDLPQYLCWLNALGATNNDMQRLGLEFLIETGNHRQYFPQSPLNYLGYRVGKSGKNAAERRELLARAVMDDLPNVGTSEYMATWGLPCTRQRANKVLSHIYQMADSADDNKRDADFSEATADWDSDADWLKAEFADLLSEDQ